MRLQALRWPSSSRIATRAFVAAGVVFGAAALGLALLSLAWPFGPDHAIMTLVGRSWRQGAPPYAALLDVKGPVAYLPYLLADWLANGSMVGLRALDLALVTLATLTMYRVTSGMLGRVAATWSAALLFGYCFRVGYIESAQPDGWVALGTAATFPLLLRDRQRPPLWQFVLAGSLAGLAALIKPQFAVLGAFPLVIASTGAPAAGRTRSIVVLFIAALCPVLVICGILAMQGALDDMIAVIGGPLMREYLKDRHAIPTSLETLQIAIDFPLRKTYNPPLLALAALGLTYARTLPRTVVLAIVGWLLATLALVVSQGRYFPYHWFPALPPLCLLAGVAVDGAWRDASQAAAISRHSLRTAAVLLTTLIIAVAFAGGVSKSIRSIASGMREGHTLVESVRAVAEPQALSSGYASHVAAGDFLRAHARAGEAVGTWLYDPTSLVLGRVMPNARLFFVHPVLSQRSVFVDSVLQDLSSELHREAPRFLVMDCTMAARDSSNRAADRFPVFASEVRRDYVPAFTRDDVVVWQHRAADDTIRTDRAPAASLCRTARSATLR